MCSEHRAATFNEPSCIRAAKKELPGGVYRTQSEYGWHAAYAPLSLQLMLVYRQITCVETC